MSITRLLLRPPFAIGRVGSARDPLDNFKVGDAKKLLGYRVCRPDETLVVNDETGEISKGPVREITFKDDVGRIRPVAPFFEVWAVTDEDKEPEPLTSIMLMELGLDPNKNVAWRVCVENRKVFRRTGNRNDIVQAKANEKGEGWFSDHKPQVLRGRCHNFNPNARHPYIDFGHVRYIRPNDDYPQIRLRFTPAHGLIYGPDHPVKREGKTDEEERRIVPNDRAIYDTSKQNATWHEFNNTRADELNNETLPPSLYASSTPAPPWLNHDRAHSRGYLDDTCDGFVEVKLLLPDTEPLQARARICSAPPAVVPDSRFVRTLADDLEQVIHGPDVDPAEDPDTLQCRAKDIIRRAYETVRFANVAVMNGNPVEGRSPLTLDTMPAEEAFLTERLLRPIWPEGTVDTLAILALHQQVFAALEAGTAPWFARLLRLPEEVADFTDRGRRKMPALMCGADSNYLALTHRQINTVCKAAEESLLSVKASPKDGTALRPRNGSALLQQELDYRVRGNPESSRPSTAIANCCPGLEVDFRAVWRRLFKGIELREYDNLVVRVDQELAGKDLKEGSRLLAIKWTGADGKAKPPIKVMARMKGPSPANPDEVVVLTTTRNPEGVVPLEWSNALASMLHEKSEQTVTCYFTKDASPKIQRWLSDEEADWKQLIPVELEVQPFFERDTAVISAELAKAGELTQGLCSPWQNDYRECSCFYWASARPDYVNVEPSPSGASIGDNWLQKQRTKDYVPDDYEDDRLIKYDDLFLQWEKLLRFQVGGHDVPPPPREKR